VSPDQCAENERSNNSADRHSSLREHLTGYKDRQQVIPNTRKGTISHLKPDAASIRLAQQTAAARWIVFPRWDKDAGFELRQMTGAEAFMRVATNAFNYEMLGHEGFDTVRQIVECSRCFSLDYQDLSRAVAELTALADAHA
jgi:hypothetical protein